MSDVTAAGQVRDDAFSTTVRIAATPAEVFPYLTDAELFVRWMGDWAKLDPVPGGVFAADVNGIPVRGEFVVVEPPDRLVFTWGVAGNDVIPAGSSTVEVTLSADGDETVVGLVHRDLPAEELPKHAQGWGHYLPLLAEAATR